MIEEAANEATESHTAAYSGSFDSSNKKFSLTFSTSQLSGKKYQVKKKKFQIELLNVDNSKLLARSKDFVLDPILKALGSQKVLKRITGADIKFNNMTTDNLSKLY